jgi:threonine dehydrogenase-like Zn-dependent dehydrogenase
MRAAVTQRVGSMVVLERPGPPAPDHGDVVIRPEAVGICGSDYHFFAGHLSDAAGGSRFPRVQGHELAGTITALGAGCRAELGVGQRVAVWPLHPCGQCHPCSIGRPNACDQLTLTGIHLDGGLQERLAIGQQQVFPIDVDDPAIGALAEPVSIAVRAVNRAAIQPGEHAVVLGAGAASTSTGAPSARNAPATAIAPGPETSSGVAAPLRPTGASTATSAISTMAPGPASAISTWRFCAADAELKSA